jgi:hypothetical protein
LLKYITELFHQDENRQSDYDLNADFSSHIHGDATFKFNKNLVYHGGRSEVLGKAPWIGE